MKTLDCRLPDEALAGESRVPPVDIYETDGEYVLNAELPGIAGDDIRIEVSGSELTIRGERRADPSCADECYHRLEGMRGGFCRTFPLPGPLDCSRIRMTLRDGVLTLVIPKSTRSGKVAAHRSRSGR